MTKQKKTRMTNMNFLILIRILLLQCLDADAANTAIDMTHSIDGSGNNIQNPEWGSHNTPRIRIQPSITSFVDGISIPVGFINSDEDDDHNNNNMKLQQPPSARRIMEDIFRFSKPHKDKTANHLLLELGHFIVHDIMADTHNNFSEPFDIQCDGSLIDIVFCPVTKQWYNNNTTTTTTTNTISFFRRQHTINSASSQQKQKQQPRATIQGQTHWLDLSNLYGHTEERVQLMRGGLDGGKILLNEDGLLPPENVYRGGMDTTPGAYCLYVLFIRYHNLMAEQYSQNDPTLSNDELFHLARQKTIAVYQYIVEEKYVPSLLGRTLPPYQGYNDTINPSIDEFFAAVGFRYAHSSFSGIIRVLDDNMKPTPDDPLLVRDTFKQQPGPNDVPNTVSRYGGINPFLRGLVVLPAKAVDASIVDDLNLWAEATSVVDIQRSRDVGIPYYNDVRIAFGLQPMESIEELVSSSTTTTYDSTTTNNDQQNQYFLINAMNALYNSNISIVDAYVGALLEPTETILDPIGPLMSKSIFDQFTRLRDGDRFWYKNIFAIEEYQSFPSMTDIIRLVCPDIGFFPDDTYQLYDPMGGGAGGGDGESGGVCDASSSQLSILGGTLFISWEVNGNTIGRPTTSSSSTTKANDDLSTIDVTMRFAETMDGPGFVGIGWGSQTMLGAEIWYCTITSDDVLDAARPFPTEEECSTSSEESSQNFDQAPMFTCCVAPGGLHVVPECSSPGDDIYYPLEIQDWCLSTTSSQVTVRAPVCYDENSNNGSVDVGQQDEDSSPTSSSSSSSRGCFRLSSTSDGKMDFIMAYNAIAQNRPHGYQRRTAAQVDLYGGVLTQGETQIADDGLIAVHGLFMLVAWMILAPLGIYIVRYMKTRTWRMVAHISIMGIVGSMMIPLLIGIEASVGATSSKSEHKIVGLSLMVVYFFMAAAGRIRYLKLVGKKVGRRTDILTHYFHRYVGTLILFLSWWNCYTGLVRIGPEDSYVQVIVFSSFAMGYDMPIFGAIRQYVYWPYLSVVVLIFLLTEIKHRRSKKTIRDDKIIDAVLRGSESIWEDDGRHLDVMTIESFLDVTRHSALCVVDGRVLDLTDFMEVHPGGRELLKYAQGSDITPEILGRRDVDGISHVHSRGAFRMMNSLVQAKLEQSTDGTDAIQNGRGSTRTLNDSHQNLRVSSKQTSRMFVQGRVVEVKYITPDIDINDTSRPTIWLKVAIPFANRDVDKDGFLVPSSAITIRGVDKRGTHIDRQYTPIIPRESYDRIVDTRPNGRGRGLSRDRGSMRLFDASKKTEEIYDFIISLVPNGEMSKFFLGLKPGKTIRCRAPLTNKRVVHRLKQNWESIVMVAAGTGVAPMLQAVDSWLEKSKLSQRIDACPRLFLVWVIKDPEHDYSEFLGLYSRVKASSGRFKYAVFYSSSSKASSSTIKTSQSASGLSESEERSLPESSDEGSNRFLSGLHLPKRLTQEQRWAKGSLRHDRFFNQAKTAIKRISTPTPNFNVKDLIHTAQLEIASKKSRRASMPSMPQESSTQLGSRNNSPLIQMRWEIDAGLWKESGQQVDRQVDGQGLDEILASVKAFIEEESDCRVKRFGMNGTLRGRKNCVLESISDENDRDVATDLDATSFNSDNDITIECALADQQPTDNDNDYDVPLDNPDIEQGSSANEGKQPPILPGAMMNNQVVVVGGTTATKTSTPTSSLSLPTLIKQSNACFALQHQHTLDTSADANTLHGKHPKPVTTPSTAATSSRHHQQFIRRRSIDAGEGNEEGAITTTSLGGGGRGRGILQELPSLRPPSRRDVSPQPSLQTPSRRDISPQRNQFPPTQLIVVSGSPSFEMHIFRQLRKICYPRDQITAFHTSKDADAASSSGDS